MTVERIFKEMCAEELMYWEAMYAIDPWDIERIERSIATLTAITYNSQLTKDNRDKAVKVKDYMPWVKIREASKDEELMDKLPESFISRLAQMRSAFTTKTE